ncbi:replication protein A 32 kDa subunit-like [Fopius arisanus]|uniref:Replication protein A 32 kDa subunit-like n=1 Tax=Fopius arisanus TaxID=64838 RepID=A0A9R1U0E7_9HYME|nr:PREDICTED: replication protein A 32 kDa subunit-like [Fopius arisanus]
MSGKTWSEVAASYDATFDMPVDALRWGIRPMMIAPLLRESPESLKKFGTTRAAIFRIVAVVKSISKDSTTISVELEDETAKTTARGPLHHDFYPPMEVQVGKYAALHGVVKKTEAGEPYFFIYTMRPVTSYGECFNHLLEVVASLADLKREKAEWVADIDEPIPQGLDSDQTQIYEIIKDADEDDWGIERSILKEQVPSLSSSQVDTILDILIGKGHIYTTHTDDHFKVV